jgi:heptose I phosphotransferase
MRETLWHRLVHGVRRLRQRPDWAHFAGTDWPDRIMQVAVTDDFHAKQGRSTGRWLLERDGRRLGVYLKRHYRLSWWYGLLACFWPDAAWSPGLQEWRHLEWARGQGLPVPAAVAAGEYIGPWCRLQSFLAVEELAGMLPLHQAIPAAAAALEPAAFRRWKHGLAAELARVARDLHRRRYFHKDFYLCHFFVPASDTLPACAPAARPEAWRGRVHLIDLHRLAHHRWTWRLWQAKDLAQLLFSADVAGIDARDRVRFWRLYRGGRRDRRARWLERSILVKWALYRRHNERRARRARGPSLGQAEVPS